MHLLIQVGEVPLSRIIQNICFRYTRYINHQKKSIGHLFQGRFKAILIDADSYLLELVRYIHLNPVRAGLCKSADEYDIDPTCLYQQGKGRVYAEARSMAALLVQGIEEISLTTLATELGRDLSAVSQAGGRLRKKLSKHKILHDRFRKLEMHIKTLKSQA